MVLEETLYRRSRLRLVPRSMLRTVLKAQELVGVSLGLAFIAFRDSHGKLGKEFVDARLDHLDAADAEATARLLRERLEKLPERRHPFYTPKARFEILALKQRNGWSAEGTARRFALSATRSTTGSPGSTRTPRRWAPSSPRILPFVGSRTRSASSCARSTGSVSGGAKRPLGF